MKPLFPKPAKLDALDLDLVTRDRACQRRDEEQKEIVARYAELYRDKGPDALPPIVVFRHEGAIRLADGFHRHRAAKQAKLSALPALVYDGDGRLAVLFALSANGEHGLPTTIAERRANAETLLKDEEWRTWSDRQIALHAHVSPQLVAKMRKAVPGAQVAVRTTKDGKKQTVTNSRKAAKQKTNDKQSGAESIDDSGKLIEEINAITLLAQKLAGHDAEFQALSEIKQRIVVAIHLEVQRQPGCIRRDRLTDLCGPLDVNPGQLSRMGWIIGSAQDGYDLTGKSRDLLSGFLAHQAAVERADQDDDEPVVITGLEEPETLDAADVTKPGGKPAKPAVEVKKKSGRKSSIADQTALTDRLHGLIVERLVNGKVRTLAPSQLMALALIVGVESGFEDGSAESYSHDLENRADYLLTTNLAGTIAAAMLGGDGVLRCLPAIPDLCRMFGIDYDTLRIQAEREVAA